MGRKEENIKKAQTLLHQKERIRNIGTAAHIDHGKCLSAESRAWVNGNWVRAGDLWSQFDDRRRVPNEYGADVRDVRSDSLWTQSLDLTSGATRFAQITHMWRLRATEPLLEVESRDGRRVKTTPEHPFVVASGDGLAYREAKGLRRGDILAVPRRLLSRGDQDEDWGSLREAIVRKLAADPRFRFELKPDAQDRLGVADLIDGIGLLRLSRTLRIPLTNLCAQIDLVI